MEASNVENIVNTPVNNSAPTEQEVSETTRDARAALEGCRAREARKARVERKVKSGFDKALYTRVCNEDPDLAWLFKR